MAEPPENKNALWRRDEQINRWNDSETNKESAERKPSGSVRFQDGCVFLAACSTADKEEVKRLLSKGADINTANIDGLTALHQVSIFTNAFLCTLTLIMSIIQCSMLLCVLGRLALMATLKWSSFYVIWELELMFVTTKDGQHFMLLLLVAFWMWQSKQSYNILFFLK